ncbi:hypothetical protein F4779DRAFT_505253 [Xylariaceae sp. FL0662B]|nr:hypothetical protein F4779DRAFT_505253 [Xylariaceae sp. FL0662B]
MHLGNGPDNPLEGNVAINSTRSSPRVVTDHNDLACSPAEDDMIPFDSDSDELSSSDVSMSDLDAEDEHSKPVSVAKNSVTTRSLSSARLAVSLTATLPGHDLSKKRKSPEAATKLSSTAVPNKKVKLDGNDLDRQTSITTCYSDKSLLPAEIWHRIFTFVPPKALGNLLCVNKLFNVYLDPVSSLQCDFPSSLSRTHAFRLKPDAILQASRRRFWQRMPTPLQHKTELDMWRLACGKRCQFCGQTNSRVPILPSDQGHPGPQPVWTFGLRICGPCLAEKTVKELDVLLSPSVPSILIPALPFALITDKMHIASLDTLQRSQICPELQVSKVYLCEHVESLKQEFLSVKSMGAATTEEWLKGLEARGKERLNDAMRWEKWASAGGIVQMQTLLSPKSTRDVVASSDTGPVLTEASSLTDRSHLGSSSTAGTPGPNCHNLTPVIPASRSTPAAGASSTQNGSPSQTQSSLQSGAQSNITRLRTREEVFDLKAARRAEIERRAMELEPPLLPNVLAHIPSFQAAIQIISPLDNNAWDLLKPRLLAQRAGAEQRNQREQDITTHSRIAQEQFEERRHIEGSNVETKQFIDKAWDDVQAPLRAQISAYADEIIRDGWGDGRKINKENSPHFATGVLLYVRKRFYAEIAKDAAAAHAAGQEPIQDPPQGPFTRKLTLENMKWIFDVKIKPHTESYRRDLFFCNGCEGNPKAYGFEGVIQHYAAKHTNALSLGSIVVHWRAEWPETPPFNPENRTSKTSHVPQRPHGTSYPYGAATPQHGHFPPPTAAVSYQPSLYPTAPPPGYGQLGYGPPQHQPLYRASSSYYHSSQHNFGHPYLPHPSSHVLCGSQYASGQLPFSSGLTTPPSTYSPARDVHYDSNYSAHQNNPQFNFQSSQSGIITDKYRTQLEDVARNSRELWTSTAGLKELPGNIRVYVVIHHTVNRFRYRFFETPPLAMFIDGLSNNKEMRPVRNVNGLMCKACHLSLSNGMSTGQDRKAFSLPQLANHFHQKHIDQLQAIGAPILDWTVDMIHTPDLSMLSSLRNISNMDSQKFSLISDAFPLARYPGGYSQTNHSGFSTAWSSDSIAPYSGLAKVSMLPPNQSPSYGTLPASRHEVLSQKTTSPDSANMPGQHQGPTQAIRSNPHHLDIGHPAVVPLTTRRKSQDHGSGRTSSDTWQAPNGATLTSQKQTSIDERNASRRVFNRKTSEKATTASAKPQEVNEEELVAEEERLQEEEIRAMWAADRKETARIASTKLIPPRAVEPDIQKATPDPMYSRSSSVEIAQRPEPSVHSSQIQDCRVLGAAQDPEDDDLIAGLESQLNQQQVESGTFDCQPKHSNDIAYNETFSYVRHSNPGQVRSDRAHPYEQTQSRSPTYIRYEPRAHPEHYRHHNPSGHIFEPVHGSIRASAILQDEPYEQTSQQEFYDSYTDEPRVRPASQYITAYEIVQVRDSQGEYFIRRPIRREPEQGRLAYEDEKPIYRETVSQYGAYEREPRFRQLRHETAPKIDGPLRQVAYKLRNGSESIPTQTRYESLSRNDPASYEDYDPRFPAAPPTRG